MGFSENKVEFITLKVKWFSSVHDRGFPGRKCIYDPTLRRGKAAGRLACLGEVIEFDEFTLRVIVLSAVFILKR